ncbi:MULTISPECIES: flagellar basal body rod protein FlgB [unclassified Acutalibacter]|jgi:flagellar basal-body rod protein FlgB|uniref:flagellar basal body rod protein FlgB n=1 Tax=unclassified Acutalibacter TaxID=2620728 RepID=UPI001372BF53|nr:MULTISPECIES: flagellar basal body rod protein FlgB [unclassified Acutalibacter]MCI9224513.1 flagellar basal body rod protein FlgB [Acutalibacter sp.]NBJ90286.1 flagellar basal body rod protein FlgB [Acutalibacter sp. 1XD8-36]
MEGITNNSMRMMERSMEFLWTKQTALLDNISNAETPNYRAKLVTFEEDFQRQLEAADHGRNKITKRTMRETIENASWEVQKLDEITRRDENGVNVTEQMTELVRNAYQMQYVFQSLTSDITALRTAISG